MRIWSRFGEYTSIEKFVYAVSSHYDFASRSFNMDMWSIRNLKPSDVVRRVQIVADLLEQHMDELPEYFNVHVTSDEFWGNEPNPKPVIVVCTGYQSGIILHLIPRDKEEDVARKLVLPAAATWEKYDQILYKRS